MYLQLVKKYRQGARSKIPGKYPGSTCGLDVSSCPSALQVWGSRLWCCQVKPFLVFNFRRTQLFACAHDPSLRRQRSLIRL